MEDVQARRLHKSCACALLFRLLPGAAPIAKLTPKIRVEAETAVGGCARLEGLAKAETIQHLTDGCLVPFDLDPKTILGLGYLEFVDYFFHGGVSSFK